METPKRKLVLVVHGVGEQDPGSTLDNFVSAITNNAAARIDVERVWLREDHEGSNPRARDSFPCPIRLVTQPEQNTETLFAEVHWADLSRGPDSTASTALELIKTVLGLGYIIRANVREVHDPDSIRAPRPEPTHARSSAPTPASFVAMMGKRAWQIRAADIFVLLAHGPNAVLNLLLALGVLITFGIYKFFPSQWLDAGGAAYPHAILLATGAAGIAFGAAKRPDNRLFRQFCDWMYFLGYAMLALVAVGIAANLMGFVVGAVEVYDLYIRVIVLALQFAWLVMLMIAAALNLLWVIDKRPTPGSQAVKVYPQAIAGMAVLWMIIATTFWVAFGAWASGEDMVGGFIDTHLKGALGLLSAAMISFLLLIAFGLGETVRRARWIARYRNAFTSDQSREENYPKIIPDLAPEPLGPGGAIPRLLLNNVIGWVLVLCLLGMAATSILILLDDHVKIIDVPETLTFWKGEWNKIAYAAAGILGTIAAVLFPLIRAKLGIGLGVGKDVINYFVDCRPFRSPVESFRDMMTDPDAAPDFRPRRRINNRFRIVLETLLKSFSADEIVIVSHSQGTMIALANLSDPKVAKLAENRELKLVTMGSPFTHLYNHYFPADFSFSQFDESLLEAWTNIYRVDDFVGTFVDTRRIGSGEVVRDAPKNIPLHPYGHTGYWFDQAVLDILHDRIGLRF